MQEYSLSKNLPFEQWNRDFIFTYEEGPKTTRNLFIKHCIFVLTCLNFSHLQSSLHLMQHTYWDTLSTAQKSFWTCRFWCLLVLLMFFCFTSSTLAKHFPLRTIFIQGNKQTKSHSGQAQVNREGGAQGSYHFWWELLNTQRSAGRCAHKSPIMKWTNVMEESLKKIHWSPIQPLTTPPPGTLKQMGS